MSTKEIYGQQVLVTALQRGAERAAACEFAGIPVATFEAWLTEHPDYAETIADAEQRAQVGWMGKVVKYGEDGPEAGIWLSTIWDNGTWQLSVWKDGFWQGAEFAEWRWAFDRQTEGWDAQSARLEDEKKKKRA